MELKIFPSRGGGCCGPWLEGSGICLFVGAELKFTLTVQGT